MSPENRSNGGVALWSCPECAFTFDASHTDVATGGHSCPVCAEADLERRLAAVERERDEAREDVLLWQRMTERATGREDAALARIAAVEAQLAAELARFGAIREIRGCLGAGPMDYELFVDELDDILAGTSPRFAALAASPTPTGPEPATTETRECHHRVECPACWSQAHEGHDVGWRHEDGSLYSATCYDCDARYRRPDPATPTEPTEETP